MWLDWRWRCLRREFFEEDLVTWFGRLDAMELEREGKMIYRRVWHI